MKYPSPKNKYKMRTGEKIWHPLRKNPVRGESILAKREIYYWNPIGVTLFYVK